jgi:hypothetical protein
MARELRPELATGRGLLGAEPVAEGGWARFLRIENRPTKAEAKFQLDSAAGAGEDVARFILIRNCIQQFSLPAACRLRKWVGLWVCMAAARLLRLRGDRWSDPFSREARVGQGTEV